MGGARITDAHQLSARIAATTVNKDLSILHQNFALFRSPDNLDYRIDV
jgi:hypothetical protein